MAKCTKRKGVYKNKIKSLQQNNKSLVIAAQNYKCESSSKEKMLVDTSMTSLEHILSARLKLNNLAVVLKEAYLSIEEILNSLQLYSSVYSSKVAPKRKLSSKSHKAKVLTIEPIPEFQESLDQGNPTGPSTCKDNVSDFGSTLSSKSSESEILGKTLQESNATQKVVEPLVATSSVTKVVKKKTPKRSTMKSRKRKNPPDSKTGDKLNSATPLQVPNKGLKNSQNLYIPGADEVNIILAPGGILQEFDSAQKSVEPVPVTSNVTKATKNPQIKRVCRGKTRKRKNPSETKANNKMNLVTQLQLPNELQQYSEEVSIPVLDEALQDIQEAVSTKKTKFVTEAATRKEKQCSVNQKLTFSQKKSNKKPNIRRDSLCNATENMNPENFNVEANCANAMIGDVDQLKSPVSQTACSLITQEKSNKKPNMKRDSLCKANENVNPENFNVEANCANAIIGDVDQLKSPVLQTASSLITDQNMCVTEADYLNLLQVSEQNKFQSPNILCSSPKADHNLHNSEDKKDSSKLVVKPKAKKLFQINQHVQELHSNAPSSSLNTSGENKTLKSIIVADNTISSANKYKTRNKVTFCLDTDKAPGRRKKFQDKRDDTRMQEISENETCASHVSPSRSVVLQSCENISYLNEELSKNIFVVSAEIHPPPSQCVNKTNIPRHVNKSMHPCVVLTDIFETNKLISSYDSPNDTISCSEVQHKKKDTDSKVTTKHGNKSIVKNENSSPKQSANKTARCRNMVSYKEPSLNLKMRRMI